MLLSRPKIQADESIESFLIRLSSLNGYSVQQLIDIYYPCNKITRGPKLNNINLNHANLSSRSRLEFFKELSIISNNKENEILGNLVYRSNSNFSDHLSVSLCRSIEIPAILYRNDNIPVCPLCLKEKKYIRQVWHIKPYLLCHEHKTSLIKKCPSCQKSISYMKDELISHCSCRYDLSKIDVINNSNNDFSLELASMIYNALDDKNHGKLSKSINLPSSNIHTIFGMIIFFYRFILGEILENEISDDCFLFMEKWPQSLHDHLGKLFSGKMKHLIKPANKSAFSYVFGELLHEIQNTPDNTFQNNHVLRETFSFLQKKVNDERQEKTHKKLTNLLLTKQEAALLLGTSTDQIAKLTAEGYLTAQQKMLDAYIPIYTLGEVFDLWVTHFQNRNSNMFYYLSRI